MSEGNRKRGTVFTFFSPAADLVVRSEHTAAGQNTRLFSNPWPGFFARQDKYAGLMWIPNCLGHMCMLWGAPSAPSWTTLTHLTSSVRQGGRFGTKVPLWPLKDILLGKALFLASERESCNQKNRQTCLGKEKCKIYQRRLPLTLSEPPHIVQHGHLSFFKTVFTDIWCPRWNSL